MLWIKNLLETAETAGLSVPEFVGNGSFIEKLIKGVTQLENKVPEPVLEEARNMSFNTLVNQLAIYCLHTFKKIEAASH